MKFILASASPRRKELLKRVVSDYICLPADIDETLPSDIPSIEGPEYLAIKKATHIAKDNPNAIILGADTSVFLGDCVLGKPKSAEDAFNMLSSLSGKTHSVITGCALVKDQKVLSFSVKTDVAFYTLSDKEILDYIATSSPFDKAGGYGIQDMGGLFVKGINGDYYNVIGLPIAELSRKLKEILK